MFGAIARFERRLIAERTKDGIAAARAKGRRADDGAWRAPSEGPRRTQDRNRLTNFSYPLVLFRICPLMRTKRPFR